jgi:hypothetical protein
VKTEAGDAVQIVVRNEASALVEGKGSNPAGQPDHPASLQRDMVKEGLEDLAAESRAADI